MPERSSDTARAVTGELAARREIAALLEQHIITENREDIPGIMATMVRDPVYVIHYLPFNISNRWWWSRKYWSGNAEIVKFYQGLFAAFARFHITLTYYAVSSTGIVDCYRLHGKIFRRLLRIIGLDGMPVTFTLYSYLGFDPATRRLAGEDVYLFSGPALKRLG
jgi:hypothetical protein